MRFIAIVSAALSVLPALTPFAHTQETAGKHNDVLATIETFKKKDPAFTNSSTMPLGLRCYRQWRKGLSALAAHMVRANCLSAGTRSAKSR